MTKRKGRSAAPAVIAEAVGPPAPVPPAPPARRTPAPRGLIQVFLAAVGLW